ncbi:dienelactone hydrolase family protein [Marinomonas mediterranea]|jgi:hypothetical protein|uniref:Dienelactone hydrolase domain-containing protein n=1 Tax=Marinomonas mediterranea (strain ATCC 700492 / JCM 21426 / NBRC 103028 / MMB-1) TaxID=717774 RepID=F2JZR5_MARM1|nr:hypothetical protein [Marinomonas mediterranea]ADZ90919.1 hypothetical protein Marme_1656 [Marinomonas mediterranea MMB-1]WCN17063.1 hypothetical protein GV053_08395 [Marinomonas mediterranea MMB-1]
MKCIFVSDIFGKTEALQALAARCAKHYDIIDPYRGHLTFDDEEKAYNYFSTHVGLGLYTQRLQQHIEALTEPVILIGFSVGASAIWALSSELNNDLNSAQIVRAECFYGSQIRNATEIIPNFNIRLIFPREEAHFSVDELIDAVKDKPNVQIERSNYLHGFMNALSKNYDERGKDIYCSRFLDDLI